MQSFAGLCRYRSHGCHLDYNVFRIMFIVRDRRLVKVSGLSVFRSFRFRSFRFRSFRFYNGSTLMQLVSCSECDWPVTHATGRTDRREECCERGYYDLHRQLNHSLFLHNSSFFSAIRVSSSPPKLGGGRGGLNNGLPLSTVGTQEQWSVSVFITP